MPLWFTVCLLVTAAVLATGVLVYLLNRLNRGPAESGPPHQK